MMAHSALVELELPDADSDGAFEALVAANHRWLSRYARLHPSFSVELSLLERNSLWMNAFFQKNRMTTSAASPQAKALIKKHRETVLERLRTAPLPHAESEFSTCVVDPMAALMYAASIGRCPDNNLEEFLAEALELMQCAAIRAHANRSGFASCIFRFLTQYTETQKRIPCLRLLVLLAEDDNDALVKACQVAGQGQIWQPNMFVYSLLKRHQDNPDLCQLATRLLEFISQRMPISSPVVLERPATRHGDDRQPLVSTMTDKEQQRAATAQAASVRSPHRGLELPMLKTATGSRSPPRTPFSPTTTICKLYVEAPSPYCPISRLPLTRTPTSPQEQSQRSAIFSMPKLAAVEGQRRHRCRTPNVPDTTTLPCATRGGFDSGNGTRSPVGALDPLAFSPRQSPDGAKKRVVISEKYSWNPECINSVSGFEWWWRSLPQNHANLEPTQKLKMVTKAAVRLHTKGELPRAIELYKLALASDANEEVKFRLRVNLACAYESAQELALSVAEFRHALELNPRDHYARFKLGSVLTAAGDFEDAREQFEVIVNEYPQAADGLKQLEEAIKQQQQEEEARRIATAAAKKRRSPQKVVSPRVSTSVSPRDSSTGYPLPVAPSTPGTQTPPPHRTLSIMKKTAVTQPGRKGPSVGRGGGNSEQSRAEASGKSTTPRKPETASVATLTEARLPSPDLLDVLVQRCHEVCVDMESLIEKLDPQQRGLVHKESVAGLFQILGGVDIDALGDEGEREALNIAPGDWEAKENQPFLRYKSFLAAFTARQQTEATRWNEEEVAKVKALLEELVRKDIAAFCGRSVLEWVREGSEKAAVELLRGFEAITTGREHVKKLDLSTADSKALNAWGSHPSTQRSARRTPKGLGDDQAAATTVSHEELPSNRDSRLGEAVEGSQSAPHLVGTSTLTGSTMDGYNGLTPRTNAKKERAREEWLLVAEKARVLARRHQHCLKSLRDIATRARAHVASRRTAVAFLAKVVLSAREELATRRLEEATIEPHKADTDKMGDGRTHRDSVQELSGLTYAAAARAAMARFQTTTELQQLQDVAKRFAALCQVPPFFLELRTASASVEEEEEQAARHLEL